MSLMPPSTLGLVTATVVWAMRFVAGAFWGYALYAVWVGRVRFASRSIDIVIEFARSPVPFLVTVCFFVVGGILFAWIAKLVATP